MTKREGAIVMAYTGYAMLQGKDLDIFYRYIAEIMGRPVFSHELAYLGKEIQRLSKPDFIKICASLTE